MVVAGVARLLGEGVAKLLPLVGEVGWDSRSHSQRTLAAPRPSHMGHLTRRCSTNWLQSRPHCQCLALSGLNSGDCFTRELCNSVVKNSQKGSIPVHGLSGSHQHYKLLQPDICKITVHKVEGSKHYKLICRFRGHSSKSLKHLHTLSLSQKNPVTCIFPFRNYLPRDA